MGGQRWGGQRWAGRVRHDNSEYLHASWIPIAVRYSTVCRVSVAQEQHYSPIGQYGRGVLGRPRRGQRLSIVIFRVRLLLRLLLERHPVVHEALPAAVGMGPARGGQQGWGVGRDLSRVGTDVATRTHAQTPQVVPVGSRCRSVALPLRHPVSASANQVQGVINRNTQPISIRGSCNPTLLRTSALCFNLWKSPPWRTPLTCCP